MLKKYWCYFQLSCTMHMVVSLGISFLNIGKAPKPVDANEIAMAAISIFVLTPAMLGLCDDFLELIKHTR